MTPSLPMALPMSVCTHPGWMERKVTSGTSSENTLLSMLTAALEQRYDVELMWLAALTLPRVEPRFTTLGFAAFFNRGRNTWRAEIQNETLYSHRLQFKVLISEYFSILINC